MSFWQIEDAKRTKLRHGLMGEIDNGIRNVREMIARLTDKEKAHLRKKSDVYVELVENKTDWDTLKQ